MFVTVLFCTSLFNVATKGYESCLNQWKSSCTFGSHEAYLSEDGRTQLLFKARLGLLLFEEGNLTFYLLISIYSSILIATKTSQHQQAYLGGISSAASGTECCRVTVSCHVLNFYSWSIWEMTMGRNLYTFSRIIVESIIRNNFQYPSNEVPSDKFLPEISISKMLVSPEKGNPPVFLCKATGVSLSPQLWVLEIQR